MRNHLGGTLAATTVCFIAAKGASPVSSVVHANQTTTPAILDHGSQYEVVLSDGTVLTHGYNPVAKRRASGKRNNEPRKEPANESGEPDEHGTPRSPEQQSSTSVAFVDTSASPGGDGASWETAYQDLQEALADAAENPSIIDIRVAEGVYLPDAGTGDRDAEFRLTNQTNLRLLGGFPAGGLPTTRGRDPDAFPTVLSGDLNQDDIVTYEPFDIDDENYDTAGPTLQNTADNSYTVVGASGADETVRIDGFIIEGGNDVERGGGMIAGNASLTISRVIFRHNQAGDDGGGLFIANAPGPVRVEGCTFERNVSRPSGAGCP